MLLLENNNYRSAYRLVPSTEKDVMSLSCLVWRYQEDDISALVDKCCRLLINDSYSNPQRAYGINRNLHMHVSHKHTAKETAY